MTKIRELVRKLLPFGSLSRSISILAGGTALGQALGTLIVPILTRLYVAEDFGSFQIYISFMTFATLLVTLRYEQAIVLPEQEETAANLVVVTLCCVGLMSVLLGGGLWFAQHFRFLPASADGLRSYLWLISMGICAAGSYQALSFWALRQKAYPRVAGTRLTQIGSQLCTQTAMGVLHSGPLGLVLGDVIGRMTGNLSLARLFWLRSSNIFRTIRLRTMWAAGVRYRRFPMVSSGSALVNAAGYVIPAFFIAHLYGTKVLGWYALGDRVLGAPIILIGQAVSQVYSVEVSTLIGSNPQGMHSLFTRSAKRLALLGIFPFFVSLFFAPLLFGLIFGHSWREAGVYVRLLAFMYYLAFISWPLMPTLNLLEEQFWQLAWDFGRLVLTLGSFGLSYYFGWSARVAIGAFSIAMLIGYAAHLLLSHFAITRKVRQFRVTIASRVTTSAEYVESVKL